MDGDCCRLRDQRHFLDGDGTNLLLIGLMKSASHATLSWGAGSSGCCRSAFYWFCWFPGWLRAVPAGTEVWRSGAALGREELQAMGPLCSREKRMLGLMEARWCCGFSAVIISMPRWSVQRGGTDAASAHYQLGRHCQYKAAWNVFFWLASLITLATGPTTPVLLAGLANC